MTVLRGGVSPLLSKQVSDTGVAILTTAKIDCKTRSIVRHKEGHFKIIKEHIQQENIKILNVYTLKRHKIHKTKPDN